MRRTRPLVTWSLARWLIVGVWVATALIAAFGYRASREWRHSSEMLAQRRAVRAANLLMRALSRDMEGVEGSILRQVHWHQIAYESPRDLGDAVAGVFAKYPYPEFFFAARRDRPAETAFFTRADRPLPWLAAGDASGHLPVRIVYDEAAARRLVSRVVTDARTGRRFSAFEIALGNRTYQVVARSLARADRPDQIEGIFGFATDLEWTRRSYFPKVIDQVADIAGSGQGLTMALLDERGTLVGGRRGPRREGPIATLQVPLLFFDPLLTTVTVPPPDLPIRNWTIQVSAADDATLAFAVGTSDQSLIVMTTAAIGLTLALLLAGRAVRASADLAKVRADFVASVTHELKTPLSTIRAIADTLVKHRVSAPADMDEYAQMLDQEAKRLTRLLENLLAYSRVTDLSSVYSFEPLAAADLVDDVLRTFQPQLHHLGFTVDVDIPPDLPPIRGDHSALVLALDNLVDNALRYSGDGRWIGLRAWRNERMVHVEVADHGTGIAEADLQRVVQPFARGRHAQGHGNGLGLAIANRVVTDHGGRFSIRSTAGAGTTIDVALPMEA